MLIPFWKMNHLVASRQVAAKVQQQKYTSKITTLIAFFDRSGMIYKRYLKKERAVKPDSHNDSDGIWKKVFVVCFPVTFYGRNWQLYSYTPGCI